MENNYFDNNPAKTPFFYFALGFLLILSFLSIGVDITEYFQQKEINIPVWFFYVVFVIDFVLIVSLLAILFYKKTGVIMYPIMIMVHFFLHEFYLSTMLYSDLFNLFSYVALGLLAIIPKWKFFN